MTKFTEWCEETETPVAVHKLRLLKADMAKLPHAVTVVAAAVPDYYAAPKRMAGIFKRLGKPGVAKYIEGKMPTTPSIKSGDLGEILCTAYVAEATPFNLGIKRLRWKDHRNMSMRGDDVLAFNLGPKGALMVLKAEVKSRVSMTTNVIDEAREGLSGYSELPSPHSLSFVSDRLDEAGIEGALRDALDDTQLNGGLKAPQVTHMLFTFSQSNPSKLLKTNLTSYIGAVPQQYVALQVETHQAFIKAVFNEVAK